MNIEPIVFYILSAILLLAVGERHEEQIAKDRAADAAYR